MANTPNGNQHGIELKVILGINDGASKANLNDQIAELEKKLKEVKLKVEIDPKAVAALEKLSTMDFSKLAQSVGKVGKETSKMASVTADELEKAMKHATEAMGINFKRVIKGNIDDLNEFKKQLAGTNANIKVDFDMVNGKKELDKLKATIERDGISQTVSFEKTIRELGNGRSDIVWMPKAIQETDKQLSNAVKNVDELVAKMNKLQTEGKITNQQFEKLTSSIGGISNKADLNRANQMMDEMVVSTKKQNTALVEQQKEQDRLIKNEQKRKSLILDVEKAMKSQEKTLNIQGAKDLISNLNGMDVASKNFNNSLRDNQLELKRLKTDAAQAGREQIGMIQSFKIAMEKFPIWMAASTLFYGVTRGAADLTAKVIELDTAMVNLQRVMDVPEYKFNEMLEQSITNVEELSGKLGDYLNLVAEFGRMGFNPDETLDMSNTAQMLTNISDLTSDESVSSLVAAMTAFNITAEESVNIADKLNEVDNQYSITTKDLAQSMNKSASTARVFGASLEELLGYTTAIGSATRETGNVVGNGIKTILSRIMTLPRAAEALNAIGISITDMQGQVKPVADVIDELGKKWHTLSAEEQQNTAIKVAGTNQLSRFNALMLNYNTAVNATTTALNAQGSATREQEKYNQSLEARINRLSTAWYGLADSMGESILYDGIVVVTETLEDATKTGDSAVASIGALPLILGITGASVALLSTRFSTWTGTMIANRAATMATTAANGSLSASFLNLAASSTVAQRALMMTGVGAALVAVGVGLTLFTKAYSKHIQAEEEFETYMKKNTEAMNENKVATEELIQEYYDLSEARGQGSWSSEKEEKYLDVQQRLGEVFPALIKSIDSTGQSHLKNKEAIEKEIKATEDLIEAQNRAIVENSNKEFEKLTDGLNGSWYDSFSNFVTGSLESRIEQQKNIIKAMNESNADDGSIAEQELKLKQLERQFQQSSEEIKGHIFTVADAMSDIKIDSNLSNMLQEFVGGLDVSKLDSDGLKSFAKEVGSIQKELQKSISSGNKKDFDYAILALNQLAEGTEGFDSKYGKLSATLQDGNISIKDTAGIIRVLTDETEESTDATEESIFSMEEYIAKLKELKSVEEQLVGISSAQISETNDLIFLYETLANKANLTAQEEQYLLDSKQKLLALYPEYIQSQGSSVIASENAIHTLKQEMKANEDLMEVIKLAKDGKLNAEQAMTYNSAMGVKARLENAKQELIALSKLVQAYRNFANSAAENAQRFANSDAYGADSLSVEAEMKMRKFAGFAREQADATVNLEGEIGSLISEMNGYTGATLDSYEATQKAEKSSKSANKTSKESAYFTDVYKQAMEKLTLELEKQQAIKAKFPKFSQQYRDAVQKEIKLEEQKLKLQQKQSAELDKQIKSGKIKSVGTTSTKTSTSSQSLSGWTGTTTGRFGDKRSTGTHYGNDIAQPKGTRLDANVSGKVIASGDAKKNGYSSTYGNLVVVQDSTGVKHLYAHLDKALAKLGSTISAGTQIGTVGSTGRSTGSHLHYETSKNGQKINSQSYIDQARKGVTATSTTGGTVNNSQQAIDEAKSDLVSLNGDILETKQRIDQLQLDAVNSKLAEFENSRQKYQRVLDFENAKLETLDNTSQRYTATLERQAQFLKYKQDANAQELRYINGTIARGKLSAEGMAEMKARAEQLKTEMLELSNAIQQIAYDKIVAIMGRYTEAIDENNYELERSKAIQETLVEGSDEYNAETEFQNKLLQSNVDELENKRKELQRLLQTEDLSIEQEKEFQKELNDTTLAILDAQDAINQYRSTVADNVIDTIKRSYEMQRDIATKQKDEEIERLEEVNEARMKQYDDDLERFEEVIDAKMRLLDEASETDQYNKELGKLQDTQMDLQTRISILGLSNSQADQLKKKELEEELAKIIEEIEEKKNGRTKDLRKKNYEDQKSAFQKEIEAKRKFEEESYELNRERLEREKENLEYYYNEMINNDAYYAQLRKDIMNGNLDEAKTGITGFLEEFKKLNEETIKGLEMSWTSLLNLIASAGISIDGLDNIASGGDKAKANSEQKKKDWNRYLNNKYTAEKTSPTKTVMDKLKAENTALRGKWGFPDGTWDKLKDYPMTFHEGGVVGGSKSNIVDRVNKLMNTKMNETMVKAEIGELLVPKKNLIGAFLPNMQNLLKTISPPPLIATGNSYEFNPIIHVKVDGGSKQIGRDIANDVFKQMDSVMRDWGK